MSNEVWLQVYARLADLIAQHRTTLVFVNTRRMAERVTRHLSELLGTEHVMAHHGSMAKELRLSAEQRLKRGELKALVATASLELGIDIGDVDLVCQLGSPRSIATFLQRAGPREPHGAAACRRRGSSRCRATSSSSARRCSTRSRRGELDRLTIPAQAARRARAADRRRSRGARLAGARALRRARRARIRTRRLRYDEYLDVVRTLADGFTTRHGHRGAYLHRDAVNGVLRARRGARLTALTSGGAIPDTADYEVVLEPAGHMVGTVNEDFAVESLAGDVFQLGNTSYRIRRIEAGRVRVEDAQGQAPNIPFWLGEAPARSDELSHAVSRLRDELFAARRSRRRRRDDRSSALRRARGARRGRGRRRAARRLPRRGARGARRAADAGHDRPRALLRRVGRHAARHPRAVRQPHQPRVGTRAAQALLRQVQLRAAGGGDRGCDRAVAVDEPQLRARRRRALSAFEDGAPGARAGDARRADVRRALALDRRHVARAAALSRRQEGAGAAAADARRRPDGRGVSRSDRVRGEHRRRARDSRSSARAAGRSTTACTRRWTSKASSGCCARIESGDVDDRRARPARAVAAGDGNPQRASVRVSRRRAARGAAHAGGDGAPLGRRRRRRASSASSTPRRSSACAREAWPDAPTRRRTARCAARRSDSSPQEEADAHERLARTFSQSLARRDRRATAHRRSTRNGATSGSRRSGCRSSMRVHPARRRVAAIDAPHEFAERTWTRDEALVELVRSRLQALGPVTAATLADSLALAGRRHRRGAREARRRRRRDAGRVHARRRGDRVVRSRAARAHSSLHGQAAAPGNRAGHDAGLRALPVPLAARRARTSSGRGPTRSTRSSAQLQGFEAPAAAWESEILPARLDDYDFTWLDDLCLSGRAVWTRLTPPAPTGAAGGANVIRTTPVTLLPRRSAAAVDARGAAAPADRRRADELARAGGRRFPAARTAHRSTTRSSTARSLLRTQVEDALAELVALGRVTSDSFAGLRALLTPSQKRKRLGGGKRHRRTALLGIEDAGRWSLTRRAPRRPQPTRRRHGRAPIRAHGDGRAHRARAAAPLRRRVVAHPAARGRVAAAVARAVARAAAARGARRHSRRTLRRQRHRRAVRVAGSGGAVARHAARAGVGQVRVDQRAPIR